MPLNTPAVDNAKPVGKVPVFIVKVDPPIDPLCVKVWLNAVLAVPVVVPGLVTVIV